jgi:hypothetical protein
MKKLFTLLVPVMFCTTASAQKDSIPTGKEGDSIRVGNMVIVRSGGKTGSSERDKDSDNRVRTWRSERRHNSNLSTNWCIIDVGFNNFNNKTTDYSNGGGYLYTPAGEAPLGAGDFKLNAGRSINVNIWFFMQRLNLIKHHVNLKYGLGLELNNYRYRSNISYRESNPFVQGIPPAPIVFRDSVAMSKNKLAADYLTVPFMLNFRTNSGYEDKGLSLSVGVSAGYLYSQRNKQRSEARGKQTNKGSYDLEQFKFSYIAEVGLGPVKLYGTYTPKSIYERQLDMRPYAIGVRFSNW